MPAAFARGDPNSMAWSLRSKQPPFPTAQAKTRYSAFSISEGETGEWSPPTPSVFLFGRCAEASNGCKRHIAWQLPESVRGSLRVKGRR